ncbi:hypothetical protein JG688_00011528, partial [Phytophthora aleatoria]
MDTLTDRVNFRELLSLLYEEGQPNAVHHVPKLKIRHLKKHLAALLKLDKYDNMCIVLPTVNCTLSGLSESAKARKSTGVAIRQDLQCDQELEGFVTLRYGEVGLLFGLESSDLMAETAFFLENHKLGVAFAAGIPLF